MRSEQKSGLTTEPSASCSFRKQSGDLFNPRRKLSKNCGKTARDSCLETAVRGLSEGRAFAAGTTGAFGKHRHGEIPWGLPQGTGASEGRGEKTLLIPAAGPLCSDPLQDKA